MVSKAVLVTGGAGFVGSHVVDLFVEAGLTVRVADDLSSGKLSNIESHLDTGRVGFMKCDVRCLAEVQEAIRDVDAVVHLAALTSVQLSFEQPTLTHVTNVEGTSNLLKSCDGAGVKKLVFVSSSSVYGEAKYLPIDENHPLSAGSPYAESKIAAENLCQDFQRKLNTDLVILRLFNVYGPNQLTGPYGGVVANWFDRLRRKLPLVIFGDGSHTRDFVFVSDVAGVVLEALQTDEANGETFNVGSGRSVSINELAKRILTITDSGSEIVHEEAREGDVKDSVASISKAREVLGYEPMVGLDAGLRRTFQDCEVK